MYPRISTDEQLAIVAACIEKTLPPAAAALEIRRIRDLALANSHCAHAFLTEAIRQWRAASAAAEAARLQARYA